MVAYPSLLEIVDGLGKLVLRVRRVPADSGNPRPDTAGSGKTAEATVRSSKTAGATPNSQRHNVGRIPELDYFARKAPADSTDKSKHTGSAAAASPWSLPYGKAGQAGALPDVHASPAAYLTAMQAHTALEFQAAAAKALESAEGRHPEPEQRWWRFAAMKGGSVWRALPTRGERLDFSDDGDPWVKHLVHVKETDSFHLATLAKVDEETGHDILVLLPTVELGGGAPAGARELQMRSLGYLGSFLLQYSSAQALRYGLHTNTLEPSARLCLELAADPRKQLAAHGDNAGGGSGGAHGTLLGGPLLLLTTKVPINRGQRAAVAGLQGGLSIIHGPPGTGKSTTIFHIIEDRVKPQGQVLVTCTRNQAVDAVVEKLARVEGSLLVFGQEERLGENAQRYTLKARVAREACVAVWLEAVGKLQDMRDGKRRLDGGAVQAILLSLSKECGGEVPAEELTSLARLAATAVKTERSALVKAVVQPAIDRILAKVLPAVKLATERRILATTRVFSCTIDSTPRMVYELAEHQVQADIDTVVVDEAGCVAEMAVPVLARLAPSNLVLVGDHLQLPAYTDLVDPPPHHCRSLMERAVGLGVPAAMLSEQYRMQTEICTAISRVFYGGKLRTAAVTAARRAVAEPCRLVECNGPERHHEQGGYSNMKEAKKALVAARKAAEDVRVAVGIAQPTVYLVSMYNRQRELLERLVQKTPEGAKLRAICACQVLSVDACQGDEADVVVVCTVRNVFSPGAQGLSSFFRGRQRVNVALSRARHVSVVVGSRKTLRMPKAKPWPEALADYQGFF